MVDFELELTAQFNSLTKKEIDSGDIESAIVILDVNQKQIQKLQTKEIVTNEDVMKIIAKSISLMHTNFESLNLFANQESLTRFQNELSSKCKQSQQDQTQLKAILNNLAKINMKIHQNLNIILQNDYCKPSSNKGKHYKTYCITR